MTVLRDVALVLAQVGTPTPGPLDVHLTQEPRDWWRDLITPGVTLIAALAGGLGGVVIGGRMNRKTLVDVEKDREAREERLDKAREQREKAMELDRERRAIDAEKRRAIGALRVIRVATVGSMTLVIAAVRAGGPWPPHYGRLQPTFRPEDEQLVATWMTHASWGLLSAAWSTLSGVDLRNQELHDHGAPSPAELDAFLNTLREKHAVLSEAALVVQSEINRLEGEIGQRPGPWPSLPELGSSGAAPDAPDDA